MKLHILSNYNEIYTPDYALDYIKDFLPKDKIYWEACYWEWHMARALEKRWLNVVWYKEMDCLQEQPKEWDILITNPPFKWNKLFIKRAIELNKPFIFLLRLEHLWWVDSMNILSNIDFKIIIPKKRINYITPKILAWWKTWWSTYHSIYLTYWIDLPKQINYITL